MSVVEVVSPIYQVSCEALACGQVYMPSSEWNQREPHRARAAAESAGWSVRPVLGKGSRSKPDLCPQHK